MVQLLKRRIAESVRLIAFFTACLFYHHIRVQKFRFNPELNPLDCEGVFKLNFAFLDTALDC